MKYILFTICIVLCLALPVSALDFTAPAAPEEAEKYMPESDASFSSGLWYIIKSAAVNLQPSFTEASKICLSIIAIVLLLSVLENVSGNAKSISSLVGALAVGSLFIRASDSLIQLGTQTVAELSEYGTLLLPIMTGAMAAQGGTTASAALYAGTAFFSSLLSSVISKLVVPMIYIYIILCIANCALSEDILKSLKDLTKWAATWIIKIVLYVFTGYMSITGVVSGSVDASAVKAAKLAISGAVPVVGSILSDASETILVSAGVMKNAAGLYGLFAILAICIGPFFKIGVQYLMLKITAATGGVFGNKRLSMLVQDLSGAMGLILAMTGTVCLLLLISIVCFMKGVG